MGEFIIVWLSLWLVAFALPLDHELGATQRQHCRHGAWL
jgi:hypothetical protein